MVAAPSRLGDREGLEEVVSTLSHLLEGLGELIEIGNALALRRGMDPRRIDLHAGAASGDLVMGRKGEIGAVDEELVLGDAHGQDLGDVVVWDGVLIPVPGDEAVDGADAVDDPGGVVGMAG